MSAPATSIAQDSLRGTAVKSGAVLLTEYMPAGPALVINTGTDRVWLGTGSQVNPSNGIPLEAGAFVGWNRAGELWLLLDPAATSSSALVLATSAIELWEQSPATVGAAVASYMATSGLAASIGVQVAQQANQLGIPPTFEGAVVYDGYLVQPANTANVVAFDFSGSATASIYITGISKTCQISYQWIDTTTGLPYTTKNISIGSAGTKIQFQTPVRSPTLQIVLTDVNTATPPHIRIYATNRELVHDEISGDLTFTGSVTSPIVGANVMAGNFVSKGGPHSYRASYPTAQNSSIGACLVGFQVVDAFNTLRNQYFFDGAQGGVSGTMTAGTGTVVLPPGVLNFVYLARTATAATAFLDVWSGTP